MSKFVEYASTVATYSGLNICPIAGSPLSQAVDVVKPKEEVEDEEVLTASLENAIEQTLINFPGGYGDITESMINELVAIGGKRLEFIQSTVAPLSSRFAQRVANQLHSTLEAASVIDYTVNEFKLPDLVKDPRFAELLQEHITAVEFNPTCVSPVECLLDESEETIVNTLESGIKDWDAKVSKLIAEGGEEYAAVAYKRTLKNTNLLRPHPQQKTQQITYLNNIDNLNDYVIAFLFLNSAVVGGYENYDKLPSGRESVENIVRFNAAALATAITAILKNHEKDVQTGAVIYKVDNTVNDILVYEDNFKDYVANGGEVEVLKMVAILARRGVTKQLKYDVSQMLEYTPFALEKFKAEINEIETESRERAVSNVMLGLPALFHEFIDGVSALELNITDRDNLMFEKAYEELQAEITEEEFVDRVQELSIELFCKVVWPRASFGAFVKDMNLYSRLDPTINPRQAAYKTYVKEIVTNLLKQTTHV